MAERINVIVTTPEGQEVRTSVTPDTIARLQTQKEMLKEYGNDDPMIETDEGEYLIVRDIQQVIVKGR